MSEKKYQYTGAKALIDLQKKHLKKFYRTWLLAKENKIKLPKTTDEDYKSLDTLLRHVLRASGRYITWICAKLELPDPGINAPPALNKIAGVAEEYMNDTLAKWEGQLADVKEELFHEQTFVSNWGVNYCIDAMLEHAVMHPIRHENQLKKLMKEQKKKKQKRS